MKKKKWILDEKYEYDNLYKAIHRAKLMDDRFIAKRTRRGEYGDPHTGLWIRKQKK